jgi:hypothetical protein
LALAGNDEKSMAGTVTFLGGDRKLSLFLMNINQIFEWIPLLTCRLNKKKKTDHI